VIKFVTVRWFSPDTSVYSTNKTDEEQTIQWPKEEVQKDKQRSTKHMHGAEISLSFNQLYYLETIGVMVMVFNATFNNI
jgi:hypothetical protein